MVLLDYRDRASVLVWVVLMGLAAQRLLTLPTTAFTASVLGSPITLTVTTNTILGMVLAGLVATGAEAVVRTHPLNTSRFEVESGGDRLGHHWMFWTLPIALIIVALLLLPVAPSGLYWLLGLILTGVALGFSMAGIYYTIDPFAVGYRRARLGMNALAYGIALVLFLVVYRTRVRSIVSATEVTLLSALLALELLRGSQRPLLLVTLYAGIAGLVLGEATWALNYWRLDSLTGGLVLLLFFYDVVGLAQNALQGRLNRRVLLEFGLISMAALAMMWKFAP
jgi:hypothetical protein